MCVATQQNIDGLSICFGCYKDGFFKSFMAAVVACHGGRIIFFPATGTAYFQSAGILLAGAEFIVCFGKYAKSGGFMIVLYERKTATGLKIQSFYRTELHDAFASQLFK